MTASALATISDEPMKWSEAGLTVNGVGAITFDQSYQWWPAPVRYYHTTVSEYPRPNPYEAAFKIVSKMMERGIIEDLTVKAFVGLVNDVAQIVKE